MSLLIHRMSVKIDDSEHEACIRQLIFNLTTFGRIEDERCASGGALRGAANRALMTSLHAPSGHHPTARQPCLSHRGCRCCWYRRPETFDLPEWGKRERHCHVRFRQLPGASDLCADNRRLLDSRVPKVNLATLHLINNLTRDSTTRQWVNAASAQRLRRR